MTGYDLMQTLEWAVTGALLAVAAVLSLALGIIAAVVLVWMVV